MASGAVSQSFIGNNPVPVTQIPLEEGLPFTSQDTRGTTITCYDCLGRSKTHGLEQRYVSPTTGICRKLNVQAVYPRAPNERRIRDHTGHTSKLAFRLLSINLLDPDEFLDGAKTWIQLIFRLFLSLLWFTVLPALLCFEGVNLGVDLGVDLGGPPDPYRSQYYKPYFRGFTRQLWEARSKKEYSTRVREEDEREREIVTHSPYPRRVMRRNPNNNEWELCEDPATIKETRYIAISYRATDFYTSGGSNEKRERETFAQEVRLAVIALDFDAYWLDLECVGETQKEKDLGVYCMADVYRRAESTLIMLRNTKDGKQAAWKPWGARVWTLPEALLSRRLLYKFRDQVEINPISLHQLADLAYSRQDSEQAVIDAYGGNDQLERLERLSLLKSAIWDRGIGNASAQTSLPPGNVPSRSGSYAAERVYALMGFFGHRIQPNHAESELQALARLSIANDSDRIAERMVSMLPSKFYQEARWYADDDVYHANLWDVLPEVQVAGITGNGALVLDGCRAACIRWKDFPLLAFAKADSRRRTVAGSLVHLAWPVLITGIVLVAVQVSIPGGAVLVVIGILLLLVVPKLIVFSEGGRVTDVQPWFIGVKGVLDADTAAKHLYGSKNKEHYQLVDYTPSGSAFATPNEQGLDRKGTAKQYSQAKEEEAKGSQMFTLVDTYGASVYYFQAEKPPTVCLFTGREGGLGRFVLCSERCDIGELHKETVLRMPTHVSDKMDMIGWLALG